MIKQLTVLATLLIPTFAHAAVITVTTTQDENGNQPENCSLREAITSSAQNQAFGGCSAGEANALDTIQFNLDGTFSLTIAPDASPDDNLDGDLDISGNGGNLTIQGRSRESTIISGNGVDRVFDILPINGVAAPNRVIENLTISGGVTQSNGGGIFHRSGARLDLNNVAITNNRALNGGGAYIGGGDIVFNRGPANFTQCLIDGNTSNEDGGGIFVNVSAFNLRRSTVSNNTSIGTNDDNGWGGGIYFLTASPLTKIMQSAIVGNSAKSGGGIFNWDTVNYEILSTTFAKNTATNRGGGLHDGFGSLVTLKNTTFAENVAPLGGAIGVKTNSEVRIQNTLIKNGQGLFCEASNNANTGLMNSLGHNIIESIADCQIAAGAGDQFNVAAQTANFTDNGSPGNSRYPLLQGSIAMNAGDAAICINNLLTDQLNLPRRGICDVGAVESTCGDGILQDAEGETCEDSNRVNDDGCSALCLVENGQASQCGNNIIELGEACDDGNVANGDGCTQACQGEVAVCGNRVVEVGETCDDGNAVEGDGCTYECKEEGGNQPCSESNVHEICCGDGRIDQEAGEACDDGNENSNDGCNSRCLTEAPGSSENPSQSSPSRGCSLVIAR